MSTTTKYTRAQVALHVTENDLWVIIDGGVYDLSGFPSNHPGGPDPLLEMAGKDATELFTSIGAHNNTQIASYLSSKMIGKIN